MISKTQLLMLENPSWSKKQETIWELPRRIYWRNYTMISKKLAAYGRKSKLLQEAKKNGPNISIEDVEEWLKSHLAYTLHKPRCLNFKTRPFAVHQINKQWQIDWWICVNFKIIKMDSSLLWWWLIFYPRMCGLNGSNSNMVCQLKCIREYF